MKTSGITEEAAEAEITKRLSSESQIRIEIASATTMSSEVSSLAVSKFDETPLSSQLGASPAVRASDEERTPQTTEDLSAALDLASFRAYYIDVKILL